MAQTTEVAVYTPKEVFRLLKITDSFGYRLIKQGRIPHIKLGHKILITRAAVEAILGEAVQSSAESQAHG